MPRQESTPSTTTISEIPASAFVTASYFLQCNPVTESHAVAVTIEEEEDAQEGGVLAVTRSKTKTAPPSEDPITPPVVPSPPKPAEAPVIEKTPAFKYESKAATPEATQRIYRDILNTVVPHLTIADLLAVSPELRKEAVEHCRTHQVPTVTTSFSTNVTTSPAPPAQIEHATPLREICVTLNGTHSELGLLDEGSEIVVIREDIWKKTNAPINKNVRMRMQTANGSSQEMAGCLEMLEIEVEGIKTWVHAYIVPDAPYRLLLGRPWQKLVRLSKSEDANNVHITITDPINISNTHTITTLPRPWPSPPQSLALTAAVFSILPPPSNPTTPSC